MPPASGSSGFALDAARLIENHQAGVWRYLRALGCDSALADDLTQETFIKILERPFEEVHDAATGAYLRRTAHNLFVSLKRKEGKVAELGSAEAIAADWSRWTEHDNGEELLAALKACLDGLTDRARRALEMRFRDHRSRPEIAAALEISEHGAKNLMQRAKQQLRECIEGKLQS
jgi:RNA polymerase sigma-70 factor (ECF subfamily)